MYDLPLEKGKIREFARAAMSRHSAYQGDDPLIPPTFLTTARLVWEPPHESATRELGFDRRRSLHGEEEFIFHGPLPRAGQTLTAAWRIAERYERPGKRGGTMRFAVIVTEFRDESGRLVAEQRSTAIETAQAPKDA